MSIDYAALKTELNTDPKALGYATPLAAGAVTTAANLLNATSGAGTATVAVGTPERNTFLLGLLPGMVTLNGLSATLQSKWDRILRMVVTLDAIPMNLMQAILNNMVSDGVLTQAQADATWHRVGSRAEVLFGAGTVIDWTDVSKALRS